MKFLGRGGSIRHAHVIDNHRTLSNTVGTTLDPIMSMRRRIHVPAGKAVSAFLITGFAKAREQLIQLVEQYRNSVDIEGKGLYVAQIHSLMICCRRRGDRNPPC